jgi:hypothetical protein
VATRQRIPVDTLGFRKHGLEPTSPLGVYWTERSHALRLDLRTGLFRIDSYYSSYASAAGGEGRVTPPRVPFSQPGSESKGVNMNREYDLFESLPDGARIWRAAIVGREAAVAKLKELASKSANEFVAMHLPTKEIVAKMEGTKDTT